MEYPKRPQYFAMRVIRLLGKTCAAQEMGATGVLLVSWVAVTEDAAGYRRPVTFFDGQLMPIVGVDSQKTLARARTKAVEAGWLVYEPGCKGRAGLYCVAIPAHVKSLDDAPSDEIHDEIRDAAETADVRIDGKCPVKFTEQTASNRGQSDRESTEKVQGKGQTFLPIPSPSPKSSHTGETVAFRETFLQGPSAAFKRFSEAYPRKGKPAEAWRVWQAVVCELVGTRGMTEEAAESFLIDRAEAFAGSPSGMPPPPGEPDFRRQPANWLKGGGYDEPASEWQKPNTKGDENGGTHRRGNSGTRKTPTERTGEQIDLDALLESVPIQRKTPGTTAGV
jgi:hypothetical protein